MRDCNRSDLWNYLDSVDVDHMDVEFFCGRIGNSKNERLGWVSMTTQENDRKMVLDAINLGRDDFFRDRKRMTNASSEPGSRC